MAKVKKKKVSKLSGQSLDIIQEHIENLKTVFPQVVKDGKVDFKALQLILGDDITPDNERYGLNWAGKMDCFRHIQEPTTATLKPVRKESIDFDNTENIFIEGDNLQVLKTLQKTYHGKIKMIYIDPPYNTGNDTFIYPDRFQESKEEYLQRIGDKDVEGNLIKDGFWRKNSKDAGHFHSNWLSMMYPRLFLAKNLLRDDGVIFVSIDDNEVQNLRMVMNEIFGEQNSLDRGCLIWINKGSTKGFRKIVKNHEYILAYGKNAEFVKSDFGKNFPDKLTELEHYCFNKPNPGNPICEIKFSAGCKIKGVKDAIFENVVGDEVQLEIVTETMIFKNYTLVEDVVLKGAFPYRFQIEEFFKNQGSEKPTLDKQGQTWLEIYFNKKGLPRYRKSRKNLIISSIIDEESIPNYGAEDIKQIFKKKEIYDFPKPKELIFHILSYFSTDNNIILDFFAGSCTTAHAAMALNAEDGGNRKYICVQLPEPCEKDSEAFKAGYKTIADIGKERIRRAAKKIKKEKSDKLDFDGGKLDLGFKVFKLEESNFKPWRSDVKTAKALKEQLSLFTNNVKPEALQENILYELILKTGLDLNVKVDEKKANGKKYFVIEDGQLVIYLEEKITKSFIEKMTKLKPEKFICLDRAFAGNDQLKTNTALQMESEKIEFKVV